MMETEGEHGSVKVPLGKIMEMEEKRGRLKEHSAASSQPRLSPAQPFRTAASAVLGTVVSLVLSSFVCEINKRVKFAATDGGGKAQAEGEKGAARNEPQTLVSVPSHAILGDCEGLQRGAGPTTPQHRSALQRSTAPTAKRGRGGKGAREAVKPRPLLVPPTTPRLTHWRLRLFPRPLGVPPAFRWTEQPPVMRRRGIPAELRRKPRLPA